MVCLVVRVRMKCDELMSDDYSNETGDGRSNYFDVLLIHNSTMVVSSCPVHARNSNTWVIHLAPRSSSANMAPKTPETQSRSDTHSCIVGLGVGLLLVMG